MSCTSGLCTGGCLSRILRDLGRSSLDFKLPLPARLSVYSKASDPFHKSSREPTLEAMPARFSRCCYHDLVVFSHRLRPRNMPRRHLPLHSMHRRQQLNSCEQNQIDDSFWLSLNTSDYKGLAISLDKGADVNCQRQGKTALEHCFAKLLQFPNMGSISAAGEAFTLEFLLLYEEVMAPFSFDGKSTMLHLCMYVGARAEIMRPYADMVRDNGVLRTVDGFGRTVIDVASMNGDVGLFAIMQLRKLLNKRTLLDDLLKDQYRLVYDGTKLEKRKFQNLDRRLSKPRIVGRHVLRNSRCWVAAQPPLSIWQETRPAVANEFSDETAAVEDLVEFDLSMALKEIYGSSRYLRLINSTSGADKLPPRPMRSSLTMTSYLDMLNFLSIAAIVIYSVDSDWQDDERAEDLADCHCSCSSKLPDGSSQRLSKLREANQLPVHARAVADTLTGLSLTTPKISRRWSIGFAMEFQSRKLSKAALIQNNTIRSRRYSEIRSLQYQRRSGGPDHIGQLFGLIVTK